jgi:hypothetical protein
MTSYAGGASNVASVGVSFLGAGCPPGAPPPSLAVAVTLWAPQVASATSSAALLAAAQLPGGPGAAALSAALRDAGLGASLASAFTFYPENMPSPPPPSPPPTPPAPPVPKGINSLIWLCMLALLLVPLCIVGVGQCSAAIARRTHARRHAAYLAMQRDLLGKAVHEKVTPLQMRAMKGQLRYDTGNDEEEGRFFGANARALRSPLRHVEEALTPRWWTTVRRAVSRLASPREPRAFERQHEI